MYIYIYMYKYKVKWSHYRPGVAKIVGRGIALLFHDRGTRRGWVVSSTARAHFTPGKDSVPILQEPGWSPGPVWTGGKSLPHRDSIPDCPARSRSLYRLSYPVQGTGYRVSGGGGDLRGFRRTFLWLNYTDIYKKHLDPNLDRNGENGKRICKQ